MLIICKMCLVWKQILICGLPVHYCKKPSTHDPRDLRSSWGRVCWWGSFTCVLITTSKCICWLFSLLCSCFRDLANNISLEQLFHIPLPTPFLFPFRVIGTLILMRELTKRSSQESNILKTKLWIWQGR